MVERPRQFSLEELLGTFPRREVAATLACAGLRRDEFLAFGPLPGELPWGPEPVSTGRWSGIAMADLLRAVGASPEARHVQMVGLDQVERHGDRFGFGGSVDLAKAMSGDVLLATELNGAPLPPPHGFPVRALVPGWIGARSVKWLGRIEVTTEPSPNYFQTRAYRMAREVDHADPRDVSGGTALTEVPLNTVILGAGYRRHPARRPPPGPGLGHGRRRRTARASGAVAGRRAELVRDPTCRPGGALGLDVLGAGRGAPARGAYPDGTGGGRRRRDPATLAPGDVEREGLRQQRLVPGDAPGRVANRGVESRILRTTISRPPPRSHPSREEP